MNQAITIPRRDWVRRNQIAGEDRRDRHSRHPLDSIDSYEAYVQAFASAMTNTTLENAQLSRQLRVSREQVRHLARKIVTVQEEERLRISRELHDEAGQALTALKLSLAATRARLPEDPETARSMLDELVSLTDRTMDHIRRLSHDLRPCVLDAYPLDEVLEGVCRDFAARSRLVVDFDAGDLDPDRLADEARVSLYRCLQEALTNVAKHARATRVIVRLEGTGEFSILSVTDDGIGFDSRKANTSGAGLVGLQERFELLGGWFEIVSRSGQGVCLRAGVPLTGSEKLEE